MENNELSHEESDKLILESFGADENSTINEEDSEIENSQSQEEPQVDEEESEDEGIEDTPDNTEEKPKKGVAKVLHQRNEARKEVARLKEKLDELESEGALGSEEYIQALIDKRLAEQSEVADFFEDNEDLKPFKKDIQWYAKEFWLPLERASKLYLAENNPDLLLEPQIRNQQKAKIYDIPGHSSKNVTSSKLKYDDAEFEKLAKEGKIKF